VIVKDEKGKTVLSANARMANTNSYNLKNLDSKVAFSKLKKGNYHYIVKAKNQRGTKTLMDETFTVK